MSKYERQASSWVYNELRKRIERLDYYPGQELQLVQLSGEMGVSRSPVRDALLRLERDRLVDIFPQKGTRVSYLDGKTIMQERFLRATLEERIFSELFALPLEEKEKLILLSKLQGTLLSQKTAMLTQDTADFLDADIAFHKVFYDALGYERIYKVVQAHTGNEHRIRLLNMKMDRIKEEVYTEHQEMADAFAEGDGEKARRILTGHFGKLEDELKFLTANFPSYFTEESKNEKE